MLDFQYNLKTSFEGTARTPVINQGIIIHGLEDRIVGLMKTAGNACSLDAPIPSLANQSASLLLKNMLIENRTLEYYFKSVAAGNTNIPASIPRDSALYRAIMENYSPAATSGCTNKYSFEKILSDLSNALSNAFQINGNALDGWKRAIALFSGDTGKTGEYQALQMRLLQGELSRQ